MKHNRFSASFSVRIDTNQGATGDLTEENLAPYPEAAWRVLLWEMIQVVLPALILALTVHLFLAQATVVYGQSMEPNLSEYQRLIIDKISYRLHPPRRNDIVVLDLPYMEELLVKRIIGLPGEEVEIRNGVVYVNRSPIQEPFPHDLDMAKYATHYYTTLELFCSGR